MKSLLVDVLREANKGSPEQTLSDSGSFDTTQGEIPETANDAVIEDGGEASEALKLYETTALLDTASNEADDDASFFETGELTLDAPEEHPVSEPLKAATTAPISIVFNNGPRVARFAPLVCITLAVFAAASWTGYQYLKLKYAESEFANARMGSNGAHAPGVDGAGSPASAERFPFIAADAIVSNAESVE